MDYERKLNDFGILGFIRFEVSLLILFLQASRFQFRRYTVRCTRGDGLGNGDYVQCVTSEEEEKAKEQEMMEIKEVEEGKQEEEKYLQIIKIYPQHWLFYSNQSEQS